MDEKKATYKVYIKTDDKNRVIAINSSAFLNDISGWIEIDEGEGDKYHHAQGNYLDESIVTLDGIYRYKYEKKKIKERTQEEMDADKPEPTPTIYDRVNNLELSQNDQDEIISEILESL